VINNTTTVTNNEKNTNKHYDHTDYNRYIKNTSKEIKEQKRQPSFESWTDPRSENNTKVERKRGRSEGRRVDYNRHYNRSENAHRTEHAHNHRQNYTDDYYTTAPQHKTRRVFVRDVEYDNDVLDSKDITLKLPRNVFEEYLEKRFRSTKETAKRSRKKSNKYTLKPTSRLTDALIDQNISSGRRNKRLVTYHSRSRGTNLPYLPLSTATSTSTTPRSAYRVSQSTTPRSTYRVSQRYTYGSNDFTSTSGSSVEVVPYHSTDNRIRSRSRSQRRRYKHAHYLTS